MCIEDIYIGRSTVDTTKSTKQVLTGVTFGDVQSLTISANPVRVGLRIFGQVILLGDSPELPTNRSQGWIEVLVDSPQEANTPFTAPPIEQAMLMIIGEHNPTELLRIETEGLLVQRAFTLRPANLDAYISTDVIINMGYTEYVFPEYAKYITKPGGWPK